MYPGGSDELAHLIADTITDRIGRLWDENARQRLSAWLDKPEHQSMAIRWLSELEVAEEERDFDPLREFSLRQPIYEALTGKPAVAGTSGAGLVNKRSRWHRRSPGSADMS